MATKPTEAAVAEWAVGERVVWRATGEVCRVVEAYTSAVTGEPTLLTVSERGGSVCLPASHFEHKEGRG